MVARAAFLMALIVLTACGGHGSDSDAPAVRTLPKLDRSSDIVVPDANSNGVRDDIDAWIGAQNVTDKQKSALMQEARSLQRTWSST